MTGPVAPARRSRGVRVAWIAVASVFTVAALAWGTVSAVAGIAHEEHDEHRVVDGPVRVVDVELDGSLTVIGGTGDRVTIDEHVSDSLQSPHRSWRVVGDGLVGRATCGRFMATWCSDDAVLHVPASVRVVGRADRITVVGTRGGLDLETFGDDVSVRRSAGPMRLRSHGGSVDATRLPGTTVDATSEGGDISLSFAAPPRRVDANSSGGNILVVLPEGPLAYRVDATAAGGSTDTPVRTDPTSSRVIRAESSGGDVSVRYVAR